MFLFIGNYLSKARGSMPVSQYIAERLKNDFGVKIVCVSNRQNKWLRLLEMILATSFMSYAALHIDVFSGKSFHATRLLTQIAKYRKKRVLLTLHGGALHEFYLNRETKFQNLFLKTSVQTPSMFLKTFFEAKGFDIAYCPNPVALANFPYSRSHIHNHSLLWVRAFSDIYNPLAPVHVLNQLKSKFPEATLTMIGPDLGNLSRVRDLIDKFQLTKSVNLVGSVPNDKLYQYYQTHSVYLNTSSYESFGVALVEAASCGIPMVSYSVGEVPFIWTNEKDILLCQPGDVDKISYCVSRLLSDNILAESLSENARLRAQSFGWDNVKEQWMKWVNSNLT